MYLLLGFILFVVFLYVGIFAHTIEAKNKRRTALSQVAARLHLTHEGTAMTGMRDGITLSVQIDSRGALDGHLYTVFRLQLMADLPSDMSIEEEINGQKLLKFMGAQDIELGLPEFDPKLVVKGRDEEAVREWARRPGVIEGLSRLLELRHEGFKIENGWLSVRVLGLEHTANMAQRIEDFIYQLVSIATCLSAAPDKRQILTLD